MKVELREGRALLLPKEEESFDPSAIPGAVRKAGFTPGEIVLTAAGTLRRVGDGLRLEMEGPLPKLLLSGGEKFAELRAAGDAAGRRVSVTGTFTTGKGKEELPLLTVDAWERRKRRETED